MPGHTPSSLGHSPSAFAEGARKKGRDGAWYRVGLTKSGTKRWKKVTSSSTSSKKTSSNSSASARRQRRKDHAVRVAKSQARRRGVKRRARQAQVEADTIHKLKTMLVGERVWSEVPLTAKQEKAYVVVRIPRAKAFTYERVSKREWATKAAVAPSGWDAAAKAMRKESMDRHAKIPFAYKERSTTRKSSKHHPFKKRTLWDVTPAERRAGLRRADRAAWSKSHARDHGTPRYAHARASDIKLAKQIVKALNDNDQVLVRVYVRNAKARKAKSSAELMKEHATGWAVQEEDIRRVRDGEKDRAHAMVISESGKPWKVVTLTPGSPYITDEIEQRYVRGWRGIVYGRYMDRAFIVDPELWSEVEALTSETREEKRYLTRGSTRGTLNKAAWAKRKDEEMPILQRNLSQKEDVYSSEDEED